MIEFVCWVWAWVMSVFSKPKALLSQATPHGRLHVVIRNRDAAVPQGEVRVRRKYRRRDTKRKLTLGALLSNLDELFSFMQVPYSNFSWVDKTTILGLRKLGVHVLYGSDEYLLGQQLGSLRALPVATPLPGLFCISDGLSKQDNEKMSYSGVVFGIKLGYLPVYLDPCHGTHYLLGMGYRAGKDTKNTELMWVNLHLTVKADGTIHIHRELKTTYHTFRTHRKNRRSRVVTYPERAWQIPELQRVYQKEHPDVDADWMYTSLFVSALLWWNAREDRWSVGITKGEDRVTFGVEAKDTARFFADRIKVVGPTGATRRIIHHVSEHVRQTKHGASLIKEHIRGLREFEWKGYSCLVTAPSFNGKLSSDFPLGAATDEPKEGYIDLSQIGPILADREAGKYPTVH